MGHSSADAVSECVINTKPGNGKCSSQASVNRSYKFGYLDEAASKWLHTLTLMWNTIKYL